MTQAYSTCNYNVMGKVDCMRSRDVTQSRFLVIFFDKFKIKMLKRGAKQLEKTHFCYPTTGQKNEFNNGICLCHFQFSTCRKIKNY